MPQFQRALDVYQGYHFKQAGRTPVGYLTHLTLGGTALAADQRVVDPSAPTSSVQVVAVLNNVLWELGATDTVYLSGQVSAANQGVVATLAYSSLVHLTTAFRFAVYDHDPIAKRYYLAFHSGTAELAGLLEKRGDELNLTVADDASAEVPSPANFSLQIGIKPQPLAQTLHLATSDHARITKAWGFSVG